MKILFLATDPLEPTGYARISYHLSHYMADQPNIEVVQISIDYNLHTNNVTNRSRHPAIKYIDSYIPNVSDKYGPPIINKVIIEENPDIVFIYNDVIVIYRNLLEIDKLPSKSFKIYIYLDIIFNITRNDILEEIAKRVDKIYVFTDHWVNDIPKGPKIGVLYHWIDPSFKIIDKLECRKLFNLNKDDFIILNSNRNSSHKQHDITIRAYLLLFKRLNKEDKKNLKLLLICAPISSAGFDLNALIKSECKLIGLEDEYNNLIFNNILNIFNITDEQLNILYNSADIGLNTSSIEGFGLTTLEMGSLNKPQIVSGVGGLLDIPYYNTVDPCVKIYTSDSESVSQRGYKHYSKAEDFSEYILKYYLNRDLLKTEGEELGSYLRLKYDKTKILDEWFKEFID